MELEGPHLVLAGQDWGQLGMGGTCWPKQARDRSETLRLLPFLK